MTGTAYTASATLKADLYQGPDINDVHSVNLVRLLHDTIHFVFLEQAPNLRQANGSLD